MLYFDERKALNSLGGTSYCLSDTDVFSCQEIFMESEL